MYKSKAQEAWAHTPAGMKALGGKSKVAEWDSASKGKKLPKRIGPKSKVRNHVKEALGMLARGMAGKSR